MATTAADAAMLGSSPLELRSSVLDAALTLGLRTSVMRKWLDDPDASAGHAEESSYVNELRTPDLTSPSTTSHSASTSEESMTSPPVMAGLSPVIMGRNRLELIDERAMPPLMPAPRFRGPMSGYDSDGGVGGVGGARHLEFLPTEKKANAGTKKSLRWRRGAVADDAADESDGGYLSEAPAGKEKEKKEKAKTKAAKIRKRRPGVPPAASPIDGDADPGALLAAVNASLAFVPGAKSDIPDRDFDRLDGYITDSGPTSAFTKRGRTKTDKKPFKGKKQALRETSPETDGRESPVGVGRKKSGFFRGMMRGSRSASKERGRAGGDRDDDDGQLPPIPPVPTLPSVPQMPLPIAERFARGASPIPPPVPLPFVDNGSLSSTRSGTPQLGMSAQSQMPKPNAVFEQPKASVLELTTDPVAMLPIPFPSTSSRDPSPRGAPKALPPLMLSSTSSSPASKPPLQLSRTVSPIVIPGSTTNVGAGAAPSAFKMPNAIANDKKITTPVRSSSLDIVRTWTPPERQLSPDTEVRRSEESTVFSALNFRSRKNSKVPQSVNTDMSPVSPSETSPESAKSSKARDLFGFGRVKTRMKMKGTAAQVPKVTTAVISPPNAAVQPPQPERSASGSEIAEKLILSKGAESPRAASPLAYAPSTASSYLFVERATPSPTPGMPGDRRGEAFVVPSSAFIVPSPGPWPVSVRSSAAFASRDSGYGSASFLPSDALDVTPTQSRSNTPELRRRGAEQRASVLAYYGIPPQMEPPSGPLPAPPHASTSASASVSDSSPGRAQAQFLSPAHPYAYAAAGGLPTSPRSPSMQFRSRSRSPSPTPAPALGPRSNSSLGFTPRPTGITSAAAVAAAGPGGLLGQPIPRVRRGRESPFPARPVLPGQDRRELVERVERQKALYAEQAAAAAAAHAAAIANGETVGNDGDLFYRPESMLIREGDGGLEMEPAVDRHSSAYIRAARARGEKRVYFASGVDMYSLRSFGMSGTDGDSVAYEERGFYEDENGNAILLEDVDEVDDGDAVDPAWRSRQSSWYATAPDLSVPNPHPRYSGALGVGTRISINVDAVDNEAEPNLDDVSPIVDPHASLSVPGVDIDRQNADAESDRRSLASASVYSRNSVLEPEKSATLRAAFVKRIAAMYGGDDGDFDGEERVPAVPALPAALRAGNGMMRTGASPLQAGGLNRF